jgi:hypothetical protein
LSPFKTAEQEQYFFLVNLHLTLNNYGLINDYKYKILNWIVRLNTPDQRWFVCLSAYFLRYLDLLTIGQEAIKRWDSCKTINQSSQRYRFLFNKYCNFLKNKQILKKLTDT